jgi:hypothetical protein
MSAIFTRAALEYREMRDEFENVLLAAYQAAEEGAHGAMLNKEGRAAGVDAYSLMIGPWSRVLKYASPELIEHFQKVGRPSLSDYESEWVLGQNGGGGWDG